MVKPRQADSTLKLIDEYYRCYRNLFSEVRSLEAFTHLHAGIISDIKRKTLPAIAKIMGLENAQGLHHFLTKSPWEAQGVHLTFADTLSGKLTIEISTAKKKDRGNTLGIPLRS